MFNIFRDTIAKDLTKIADYFNGVADAGTIFKDKRTLAVNRIKNAVLNGDIGGGGVTPEIEAEIENAQWKTETSTPLFSETVTTAEPAEGVGFGTASLEYSDLIDADTLIVTFDGTEYVCQKTIMNGTLIYGAAAGDFSEYPFAIGSSEAAFGIANEIYTETPGSHAISVSASATTYTDPFKEGVHKNVLKEVENESDADIVVLTSLANDVTPSETKNCLKLSTSGNPTSYTETETFGAEIIVLYKAVDSEFTNGVYSYFSNGLTKNARCYYGSSSAEPTGLAFRIESSATLENVSDYYTIKYLSYGLNGHITGGESGGESGGGGML